MRVTCNYCQTVAYGSKDELIDKGWTRAKLYKPIRNTFTCCDKEDCYKAFTKEFRQYMKENKLSWTCKSIVKNNVLFSVQGT